MSATLLSALYNKAWGKKWPREERLLDAADVATSDSNAMDIDVESNQGDVDVSSPKKYVCLVDMGAVKKALEIGPDIGDTLVVRQEYESLVAAITTGYFDEDMVVTGQPGIGKTMFLYYFLLYRLERKLPTAIQISSRNYLLFDEEGAEVFPLNDGRPRINRCWALADSNAKVIQPCDLFLSVAPRIVQTTSPKRERFKEWAKQRDAAVVVMGLPTTEDIVAIVKERGYAPSLCLPFMEKWGPSILIILQLLRLSSGRAAGYETMLKGEAEQSASKICTDTVLFRTTNLTSQNALDSLFSNLIFVRPRRVLQSDGYTEWQQWYPWIPTQYLIGIFEAARVGISNERAVELFEVLSRHSFTRSPACWSYELRMHRRICTSSTGLSIFREGDDRRIPPSHNLIPGTLSGLKSTGDSDGFYWIPTATTFPGVDGVLGDADGEIYAVQATIASEHESPVAGLQKVWKNLSPTVRLQRQVNMVLVADTRASATNLMLIISNEMQGFSGLGKEKKPVVVWGCHLDATE